MSRDTDVQIEVDFEKMASEEVRSFVWDAAKQLAAIHAQTHCFEWIDPAKPTQPQIRNLLMETYVLADGISTKGIGGGGGIWWSRAVIDETTHQLMILTSVADTFVNPTEKGD